MYCVRLHADGIPRWALRWSDDSEYVLTRSVVLTHSDGSCIITLDRPNIEGVAAAKTVRSPQPRIFITLDF